MISPADLAAKREKLRNRQADGAHSPANHAQQTTHRRGFDLSSGAPKDVLLYQQYVVRFNMERWLELLAGATFPTMFVSMNADEVRSLLASYETKETPKLPALSNKLKEAMSGLGGEHGCFVKTSSRSAKDYADPELLRLVYTHMLGQLGEDSENARMVAMSYASMNLLRKHDPAEVIENFSKSERIWHDMNLALAAQDGTAEQPWEESLVVRSWVDIQPDMEFRCFVTGGHLRAISQYRALVHFPRLAANHLAVRAAVVTEFEDNIKHRLVGCFPMDDYVLDIAVELQSSYGPSSILSADKFSQGAIAKVWVIEVNPHFETTDGCLYDWKKDSDLLLSDRAEGSCEEPEFRIREQPAKGCSALVYGPWREVMSQCAISTQLPASAV